MKKRLFTYIILLIILSASSSYPQFLRWNWWRINPALSLIGFNNTLNPDRTGAGSIIAEGTFTPGFGYRTLTPTNLTSQKGILLTQSDNLQYTRGSLQGGDGSGVIYENFDPNQGTLEFWVRPNFASTDTSNHYIFDEYVGSSNQIQVWYGAGGDKFYFAFNEISSYVASILQTFSAGTWIHVVVVWSMNETVSGSYYYEIYINGSNASNVYYNATTKRIQTDIESSFHIGERHLNDLQFDGVIAGRILNRPLTSAEVTALYASGAGHTDSFVCGPDVVWMGIYSDSDDDEIHWHRGQSVSSITNGATESTVTLGEAVGLRSWKDNDRILISDGCGGKAQGFIDEGGGITSTDTTLDVDDGAGAVVSGLSGVGRSLDFDATYYAQAANNTIHDITMEDIGFCAWVRKDTNISANSIILAKRTGGNAGYTFYVQINTGVVILAIDDGPRQYTVEGTTPISDNEWHFISVIMDKSNRANCKIYIDGYEQGTITKLNGVVTSNSPNVDGVVSLTNTSILTLAAASDASSKFSGQIRDIFLAYPADIMAAGEMGAPGKILALATNPRDTSIINFEDYWALTDDAANTTVVGSINNLTASANTNTFSSLQAFLSKNLIAASGMEAAGIGGWTAGDAATTLAKSTTTVKFDTRSLKITNGDASQAFARQTITTAAGEDYHFHGWFYAPATPNGASQLVDVDATAALGITVTQAGATVAATWYEFDFTFEAADASTTIDFGSGSATNAEIGYWDNVSVRNTLVDDGGMESVALASWTQEASATMAADTSEHAGAQEMKITAGADNVGATQAITLVSGKYYTVSGWARATSGDTARIIMDTGDTTLLTSGDVTATAYTKISKTFKSTGTAGNIYLRGVLNTDIVWFDDVSVIPLDQDDPTTTGTTMPSTSANSFGTGKFSDALGSLIVDGLDTLTYPNTNLTADRGSIAFWANIKSPYTTATDRVLLDIRGADDNNRVKIFYQASDDKFTVYINGANRIQSSAQVNNNNFYSWHHFVFAYDFVSDQYALYLDGALIGTDATALTAFIGANVIYVGSNYDGSNQGDAFFDDVFFFKRYLTLNEVRKLYALPRSANFRSLSGGW